MLNLFMRRRIMANEMQESALNYEFGECRNDNKLTYLMIVKMRGP